MALVSSEDPRRKLIGSRTVLTSASPSRNLGSRLTAGAAGRADNQVSDTGGCRWEEIRFDVSSSPANGFQRQSAGVYHSAPFPEATAAAKRRGASSGSMLPVDLPRFSMDAGARSDVTRGLESPSSADNISGVSNSSDDDYRGGGDGAGAGESETAAISERERLFLQQLRRNSIATRERILSNVADVWISHQESESWLGQLEKLAAAQQSGKHVHVTSCYGQQQHSTWRAGGNPRKAQGTAECAEDPQLGEVQAAHEPRGVRKLKRSAESAKSAQFEYSTQQPLSPPAAEQTGGTRAQIFERTSTARSGTTSTTTISSSNNRVGSDSGSGSVSVSGSGGSDGRATVVTSALARKSWLFGFSSRSTQERSTSRLGASPHGGSS